MEEKCDQVYTLRNAGVERGMGLFATKDIQKGMFQFRKKIMHIFRKLRDCTANIYSNAAIFFQWYNKIRLHIHRIAIEFFFVA